MKTIVDISGNVDPATFWLYNTIISSLINKNVKNNEPWDVPVASEVWCLTVKMTVQNWITDILDSFMAPLDIPYVLKQTVLLIVLFLHKALVLLS